MWKHSAVIQIDFHVREMILFIINIEVNKTEFHLVTPISPPDNV